MKILRSVYNFPRRIQTTILNNLLYKTTPVADSQQQVVGNPYQFFINCYKLCVLSLVLCQLPCGRAHQPAVQDLELKNDLCHEEREADRLT